MNQRGGGRRRTGDSPHLLLGHYFDIADHRLIDITGCAVIGGAAGKNGKYRRSADAKTNFFVIACPLGVRLLSPKSRSGKAFLQIPLCRSVLFLTSGHRGRNIRFKNRNRSGPGHRPGAERPVKTPILFADRHVNASMPPVDHQPLLIELQFSLPKLRYQLPESSCHS